MNITSIARICVIVCTLISWPANASLKQDVILPSYQEIMVEENERERIFTSKWNQKEWRKKARETNGILIWDRKLISEDKSRSCAVATQRNGNFYFYLYDAAAEKIDPDRPKMLFAWKLVVYIYKNTNDGTVNGIRYNRRLVSGNIDEWTDYLQDCSVPEELADFF